MLVPSEGEMSRQHLLNLDYLRSLLIRFDDTIVYGLIERVQYPFNSIIYEPHGVQVPNSNLPFMDWLLYQQEHVHSLVRRYESPYEYPFFSDAVQKPLLPPIRYPQILHQNNVNINTKLKEAYQKFMIPKAFSRRNESDLRDCIETYGSAADADIFCLQALSRRIHTGKFVAESKFLSNQQLYENLIRKNDRQAILDSISDVETEKKVLNRISIKAKVYGTDPDPAVNTPCKIFGDVVEDFYRDFIIPLTKEVEVEYLLERLNETRE